MQDIAREARRATARPDFIEVEYRKLLPVARPPVISGYGLPRCAAIPELYRAMEGGIIPIIRRIGGDPGRTPYVSPLRVNIAPVCDPEIQSRPPIRGVVICRRCAGAARNMRRRRAYG